ncbi:MAG: aminopeptidase [Solirubrobacteraceae bacterium]
MVLANQSDVHVDFMIGGDDILVTGCTRGGREIPLLRSGIWQL